MSTMILVRPGCTDFDEQNRVQGTLQLPLNHRGRKQVDRLIEQLREEAIELVLVGPGEPANATAVAIGEALDVAVKTTDKLANLDQGLWQGLEIEEVRRKYPKVFKQWQETPERICPPRGEPVSDAIDRIRKAICKAIKKQQNVVVVAPEPLASLVADVVREELAADDEADGQESPHPLCGCRSPELIEYLIGSPKDEPHRNGHSLAS